MSLGSKVAFHKNSNTLIYTNCSWPFYYSIKHLWISVRFLTTMSSESNHSLTLSTRSSIYWSTSTTYIYNPHSTIYISLPPRSLVLTVLQLADTPCCSILFTCVHTSLKLEEETLHDMDINGKSVMVAKDPVTSENRRTAMDNTNCPDTGTSITLAGRNLMKKMRLVTNASTGTTPRSLLQRGVPRAGKCMSAWQQCWQEIFLLIIFLTGNIFYLGCCCRKNITFYKI